MSPADGAFFGIAEDAALVPDLAIILPGGRTLLALSHLREALPAHGFCGDAPWQAICWPVGEGHAGLALVGAPLVGTGWLRGPAGDDRQIAPPRAVDVAPAPLAEFVRRNRLNSREVFDFLIDALAGDAGEEARSGDNDFAARFLSLASDSGGFVEILACPDTGGLFAQGWAMSLAAGRHKLARLDGTLKVCDADVAVFSRGDIPSPGMGFCLFSLDWRGTDLDRLECLFHEQDGILKRLEIVRGSVLTLYAEAAADHVRQMLPRLAGDGKIMGIHRRICRPRYQGIDTLSLTPLPVAAAFDAVFQAPSGGLLATGWLLDPMRRVERVIIKSTAGLYAPLHDRWNPLPRADLNDGFGNDPRFARLLDTADSTHGFVAFAPGPPGREGDEDFYLELVLDDGACLFRPLTVTRLDGRNLLPQILAAMPLHDPAIDLIVENALAPFLAQLPAGPRKSRARQRPVALSPDSGEITAVIPLTRLDHLQPMMALLSGTPEADRLDLAIVMARAEAAGAAARLKDLFAFYRLRGRLLLVADQTGLCARIEAGLALAKGPRVLVWQPSVLPAAPGWLSLLEAELAGLGTPGLISPTLVYEDGSIFHGAVGDDDDAPMLGYPRGWLIRGAPCPMPAGAAQLVLIDREAMDRAGGFSGRLYSDAMVHRDLARRLHEQGCGTWSSRSVEFWMLDDKPAAADGVARLLETVDSELLGKTAQTVSGVRIG